MLDKKSVIEILTRSLFSGIRPGITNPRVLFESKSQSAKGFDLGAVGLGIVAALEKSGEFPDNKPLFSRNLNRSKPIQLNSPRNRGISEELNMEEYTIVTHHGSNKSYTRVYGDCRNSDDKTPLRIQNNTRNSNRASVFQISPARSVDVMGGGASPSDFLSSCNLCLKKLNDKDIYIYMGEKSFCSTECRSTQIVMDERKEKYKSKTSATRPVEFSGLPYSNGQIFTTGILAI